MGKARVACRPGAPAALVALLAAAVFCALAGLAAACPASAYADEGTSQIRVLFVGNSMTHRDKEGVAEKLRSLAKANGRDISVGKVAYDGKALSSYAFPTASDATCRKQLESKLSSGTWDYVVLQDKATRGVTSRMVAMHSSVRALRDLVARYQPSAEVLLYMTHGYDDGTSVVRNGKPQTLSASDMQLLVQGAYTSIGKRLGLRVVPVGMYFWRHGVSHPQDQLLASDGKHPNAAGYFLGACAFYQAIFGEPAHEAVDGLATVSYPEQLRLMSSVEGDVSLSPSVLALSASGSAPVEFATGDAFLVYGSVDPDIASVGTDGHVHAAGAGSTVAYVESSTGLRATCAVSVESGKLRRGKLLFGQESATMAIGKSHSSGLQVSDTLGDYELSWSSSNPQVATVDELGNVRAVKAGKAKIGVTDTVSGYSASYTVFVRLAKPADVKVRRVKARGKAALKLTWGRVADATGYRVYRLSGSGKAEKRIATTTRHAFVDKKAPADAAARYRVVAKMGPAACASKYSSAARGVVLSRPAVAISASKKAVKLGWNRNRAADGYVIMRAVGKSAKFRPVKTVKDPDRIKWSDTKVKAGKTYRYKVYSYRNLAGTLFRSPDSAAKATQVPKPESAKKRLKAASPAKRT